MKLNLQLFGGRGSDSGLQFSLPSDQGRFDANQLSEQLPETSKQALGPKGKPKSIADSLKNTNPNYNAAYAEYSENCQRCVVAYELRRRGYDVEAQPTYSGDQWPYAVTANGVSYGRWRGAFRHAKTVKVGGRNADTVLNNIRSQMRTYGKGSRAVVQILYKGNHGGHVFSVENVGGSIQYVDAQTGQRYNQKSMHNLLAITQSWNTNLTRTDNLRVSERSKEFVWQRNRNKNK